MPIDALLGIIFWRHKHVKLVMKSGSMFQMKEQVRQKYLMIKMIKLLYMS